MSTHVSLLVSADMLGTWFGLFEAFYLMEPAANPNPHLLLTLTLTLTRIETSPVTLIC